VAATNKSVTRKIVHLRSESIRHGWIGRQLPALFRSAGLREIAVTPVTLITTEYAVARQALALVTTAERAQAEGAITEAEATAWLSELEASAHDGTFFSSVGLFIVRGRAP